MQQYFYQGIQPGQVTNPAASKALNRLKNDKLLLPNQQPFIPQQQSMQNRSYNLNRPVSFNNTRQSVYARNISPSPNQAPLLNSKDIKGPVSSFSNSQISQNNMGQSQRLNLSNATYSQPPQVMQTLQHQPSQPIIPVTRNQVSPQAIMKPFSAVNNSSAGYPFQNPLMNNQQIPQNLANLPKAQPTNPSTQNETRMRSSSTSQINLTHSQSQVLSLNNTNNQYAQKQAEQRIKYLDSKINEYSQQIMNTNNKLSKKESIIGEMERQMVALRKVNSELEIKLVTYTEKIPFLQNKLKTIQQQNQKIKLSKIQLELQNQKNMQKVMTLQSTLDKIQQAKALQIQSLNHSCMQLSKNVELLHSKYSQQIRTLNQRIEKQEHTINQQETKIFSQESIINHDKEYFDNLNERIKLFEKTAENRERDLQELSRVSNQQINKITFLEIQNKNLKIDLSNYVQQMQLLKSTFYGQQQISHSLKQQLNRITIDHQNAKKIGQQQIQFLQSKLQESVLQKQRLLEQIQLTKAITLKRNMIFERQVIYELKAENDRLWAKLIQQSENKVGMMESDPEYWNKRFAASYHSKRNSYEQYNNPHININIAHSNHQGVNPTYSTHSRSKSNLHSNIIKNHIPNPQQQTNAYKYIQQQYLRFIENLEQQEQKATKLITQIGQKQQKNNIQDMLFYKNKCNNLQDMVQEHLKINLSLKEQLQKAQILINGQTKSVPNPADAQILFLKGQLSKQTLLNQTLQRSFDLFKSEYQLKFKAAQARVTQIQNQHDKAYNNTDQIRKQLSQAQYEVLRLTNQNFAIKNRLQSSPSQQTKYQDMYYELLSTIEKRTSLSQFNLYPIPEASQQNKKSQIVNLKQQLKRKEDQYIALTNLHKVNCQALQEQLAKKGSQFMQLQHQHEKLIGEYQNNKYRVDQLAKQFTRVEKELAVYKKGTNLSMSGVNIALNQSMSMSGHLRMSGNLGFDKKMAIYYTSLLRSKLLQLDAFIKELKQVHSILESNIRVQGLPQFKEAPYILELIVNIERVIDNCLGTCSQLEVNCRD